MTSFAANKTPRWADQTPRYAEALAHVRHDQSGSTSRLQRRMRIGYNEACRYIERLEDEGERSRQTGYADPARPRR
ncbi:DNA translocase FtsK [Sphingomonas sp. Leaf343]|uniref:DNA translocase FtsK n=1 Tax=Sphingomonas sp. Leaf343 TaxID=1736345 RepID=UPI0006F87506|nr:DNA translocase FtsK [Sphingomonas sp. Leaf343]KQR83481.1 hypothetical protein ASG07_07070 [Sphingomonas sp. Leaf343]